MLSINFTNTSLLSTSTDIALNSLYTAPSITSSTVLPPFLRNYLTRLDKLTENIIRCLTTRPLSPKYLRNIQTMRNTYFQFVSYLYNNLDVDDTHKFLFSDSEEVRRIHEHVLKLLNTQLNDFIELCDSTVLTTVYNSIQHYCDSIQHTFTQFNSLLLNICNNSLKYSVAKDNIDYDTTDSSCTINRSQHLLHIPVDQSTVY